MAPGISSSPGGVGTESAALEARIAALQHTEALFHTLLESAPDAMVIVDSQGVIVLVNRQMTALFGYAPEECLGQPIECLLPEGVRRHHVGLRDAYVAQAATRPMGRGLDLAARHKDGHTFPVEISLSPIQLDGDLWVMSIIRDVTERRALEQARQDLQERMIAAQRSLLHELSTPLFPLDDDVVLMPLVGGIDSQRALQLLETLLHGIGETHARVAILDITGVPVVDTQVAYTLIQAANAARLLGATVIVTGIRPEIAQLLVSLGISLRAIQVYGSLKEGLRAALTEAHSSAPSHR